MEPRAAVARYDKADGALHDLCWQRRRGSAKNVSSPRRSESTERIRVLSYDVGGNFGTRNRVYVEFGLVLWASRKVGRPVRHRHTCRNVLSATTRAATWWQNSNSPLMTRTVSGPARDQYQQCRRALRLPVSAEQRRRIDHRQLRYSGGVAAAMAVFTNTAPTQAYRSSGRPEITFALERLIDIAAKQLGIDRVTLRRRNLVRPRAMPYRDAVGMLYDSGRMREHGSCHASRRLGRLQSTPALRPENAAGCLGRGLANYVESSIGAPKSSVGLRCPWNAASRSSSARNRPDRDTRRALPRWWRI